MSPANFNYLAPLERLDPPGPPYRYTYTPPHGVAEHNEILEKHDCQLSDIRGHETDIGLDISGFGALYDIPATFKDWDNDKAVKDVYYADITKLIKERLGATRVTIFDHTIRMRSPQTDTADDSPGKRQPVFRVHVDQTPSSGRERVYRHDLDDADRLLKTRTQIINVWRPLRGPVLDAPLGLCHRGSVADEDFIQSELRYPDRLGSTYLVHHNPAHEWYHLSAMQPDEALLIKCYDNKLPHMIAVHSGFILEVPEGIKWQPRQSIEVRCIVYYEDQPIDT